jgi:Domain of unknown function (DUF4394)
VKPALRLNASFALSVVVVASLAGCASTPNETVGPARDEKAVAVTASNLLVKFNAGQPQKILARVPLTGLAAGETVLGVDYRISKDTLYLLGSSGRLYTVDEAKGALTPVGANFAVQLSGTQYGFDFNPTVDRIRVVSGTQNLRLHPDTGAVVDANPNVDGVQIDAPLAYAATDANTGKTPRIVAAAYSYNKANPKITTNYVLDAATGTLALQGSREGTTPAVSPNTGQLSTVGKLGVAFDDAHFDIQALSDVAFAALSATGQRGTRWYTIDVNTGAAKFIGTIGVDEMIQAIALEPSN